MASRESVGVQSHPSRDDEKASVRAAAFHHLSGIVVAPTVKALWDRGVLQLFDHPSAQVSLDQIEAHVHANRGYLRVALRLLVDCGWLQISQEEGQTSPVYTLTEAGGVAFSIAPALYGEAVAFIPKALFIQESLFGASDDSVLPVLDEFARRAKTRWGMGLPDDPLIARVENQIRDHLDGLILGPIMVALSRGGVFAQIGEAPTRLDSLTGNKALLRSIFGLLEMAEWVVVDGDHVQLTSRGKYAAQIATSYGVTVSYLPTLNSVSTLLFGNPRIPRFDENGVELLVDRAMNVWGSGGAHKTYFRKVDEIILEIFNRPLEQQPKGICDMGCGDGTLLDHLYTVIKTSTARGRALDTHPLIVVGADYNKVARRVSKQMLRRSGIPVFHVINGDINRPAQLAGDFEKLGLDIHDFFHVRSFLDHNRPYLRPANHVPGSRKPRSTGAFVHLGEYIPAEELEENLVRHLRRWAPYIGRFGLLVLELHTLPPTLTAANLDRTPAVAYDGTHGYSDQYLVELPVFLECAREAGLKADLRYQARFPPSDLATVSINLFAAPGASDT